MRIERWLLSTGQTTYERADGRTPDRYIDPALHTTRHLQQVCDKGRPISDILFAASTTKQISRFPCEAGENEHPFVHRSDRNRTKTMVEQDKGNKDGLLHGLIRRALGLPGGFRGW